MSWQDKDIWSSDYPGDTARHNGRWQRGFQGNGYAPTKYTRIGADFGPAPKMPNGARQPVFDSVNYHPIPSLESLGVDMAPAARNKAWSSLIENMRDGPASLGIALAEMPKSLSMVAERAVSLRRAWVQLRRGNVRGFCKALDITPKRKHRKGRYGSSAVGMAHSQASSIMLEYHFGWRPFVQDMYDGVNTVCSPLPGGAVSGSGFQSWSWKIGGKYPRDLVGGYFVKQGAHIYVVNPNLYLLQQLGIANPLSIAWEVVPFSFLVDYVFDIGTALGGLTDLFGCSVLHPFHTIYFRGRGRIGWQYTNGKIYYNQGSYHYVARRLGLSKPSPNIAFRANIGTSMTRAATAVSLLGQSLTK